jgi:hypothetical protein
MDTIRFRVAQRDDYRELAEWLVNISQDPEHHSLHSWSGQNPDSLWRQLLTFFDDSELYYMLAYRGDELVGAVGGEYDEELSRGWLHGRHVII